MVSGDEAPGLNDATFGQLGAGWVNGAGDLALWARLAGPGLTDITDQSAWVERNGVLALVAAAGEAPPGYPTRAVSAIGQVLVDDDGRAVVLVSLDDGVTPHNERQPPLYALFRVEVGGQRSLIVAENWAPGSGPRPPPDPANGLVNWVSWAAASDAGVLAFDGWTHREQGLSPWLTDPYFQMLLVDAEMFRFHDFDAPTVGPGRHVVFRAGLGATVTGPGLINATVHGLMLDGPDEPIPLLLSTDVPAPLLPSIQFADFAQQIAIGRGGEIAFRGRTRGDGGSGVEGVWVLAGGVTTPVVQEGDALPGAPLDRFGTFAGGPAMNLHGDIAIRAIAEPGDVMQPRSVGLWCFPDDGGAAWQVAIAGQPVPGIADASYVYFTDPTMTDAGRIVFLTGVAGAGVGDFTQTALVAASRDGGTTVLARTGVEMTLNGVASAVRDVSFTGGRNPDGGRHIASHAAADEVIYEVLLEDDRSALIRATIGHGADYDRNGRIDDFDVLQYVNLWIVDSGRADIVAPAAVDVFDLLAFLDCWFAGVDGAACP